MRQRYFGDRLDELPEILAGPILRRVNATSVTVWLALTHPAQLELSVFKTKDGMGEVIGACLLIGEGQTVAIGQALHLCAITATGQQTLQPNQIYAYDVKIQGQTYQLCSLADLPAEQYGATGLSYFAHQLPTFATPSAQIQHLKIMHGSCRKPHGGGEDLLPLLDQILQSQANSPTERIQQIFFTGDQIYGDDVADSLLWIATDVGDMLLGWTEKLPIDHHLEAANHSYALKPGVRAELAKHKAGLTSTFGKSDDLASSHFFALGEYFAAYLLVWSPYLWPLSFPAGAEIQGDIVSAQQWDKDVANLQTFIATLPQVRRAIANVPTYMICDDHDISDDWYLNRKWCQRVLGKPLGYRVVMNGLIAYAFCQAWGNTPEQFMPHQSGAKLCQAVERWSSSEGSDLDSAHQMAQLLGLPDLTPDHCPAFAPDGPVEILDHHPQSLKWHYRVEGFCHEVIVLDTRTWRGYPLETAIDPPMLLSPTAFDQQLESFDQETFCQQMTFIVLPTNLVSLSLVDLAQRLDWHRDRVFRHDVGDSWNFHEVAFTRLLLKLSQNRQQVIILSGDIHYSCAVKLQVWPKLVPSEPNPESTTLIQLTCSAIKNAEVATHLIHTKLKSLLPEPSQDWLVWHHPPQIDEYAYIQGVCYCRAVSQSQGHPYWHPTQAFTQAQGNSSLAWRLKIRDRSSWPDWRYQIQWIPRQSVAFTPFQLPSSRPIPQTWIQTAQGWFGRLWQNRWMQEGDEVIGHNNIGIVSFSGSLETQTVQVHQDCYWIAPWKAGQVVRSRFSVPLNPSKSVSKEAFVPGPGLIA